MLSTKWCVALNGRVKVAECALENIAPILSKYVGKIELSKGWIFAPFLSSDDPHIPFKMTVLPKLYSEGEANE